MSAWLTPDRLAKAALAALAAAALLAVWAGYGRADIVRWFGAFLLCG